MKAIVTMRAFIPLWLVALSMAQAQPSMEVWVQRYNGPGDADDRAEAILSDTNGNVIVTGYSYGGVGTRHDYLTIKYSSSGVPVWTNRYNGPANGNDYAFAVAIDRTGNVFVTGHSATSSSEDGNSDMATVAYSSTGALLWTNRYHGPGNGSGGNAIATDKNGNVFVAGSSSGIADNYDFVTIAYSGAGSPLWTNRYDGTGNSYDSPRRLAVDKSGNVFVTGSSSGSPGTSAFITVAYSNTGVPLWTNRYVGPGNGYDSASAVAVDNNGKVFVTGSSIGDTGSPDFLTLAYSTTGIPLWTNRYVGPASGSPTEMAVDSSGNVFVTGYSYGFEMISAYGTVAYSGEGVPLWTNRYLDPGNKDAYPYAIVADQQGNVIVAGSSDRDYGTIAYSNTGIPLWTNRYDGPSNQVDSINAITVDGSGNVYVTGESANSEGSAFEPANYDYATIKYSSLAAVRLTISLTPPDIILSWPINPAGFNLIATTNLSSTNWTLVSPSPNVVNQWNFVTNPVTGTAKYYRLRNP